jgi:hypothetical protein
MSVSEPNNSTVAARCHEIQTGLGFHDVPDFENLPLIGMAVRLALHIRGLPPIKYDTLKLVASHFLNIPGLMTKDVVKTLAEVEFVKLQTQGTTIQAVVPFVPYYDELYAGLGSFALNVGFNEAEQLSIDLLTKLSTAPQSVDKLRNLVGAEESLFSRAFEIGAQGSYINVHRTRSRNIALSPTFFSENPEVYADMVAAAGAVQVSKLMKLLQQAQGIPLSIVEASGELAGTRLTAEEISMLKRLAHDGAVKPPSIQTSHHGENFFLFTPTPSGAALASTKRHIYEKAMAIVSAVRQGQYLPAEYAIRRPGAVIYTLKRDLRLGKATTEANQQYRNLVHLCVAHLVDVGNGFSELRIIETRENKEALRIALALVDAGATTGIEIDDEARNALQQSQTYIESLVASGDLRRRGAIPLSQNQQIEIDKIFIGG